MLPEGVESCMCSGRAVVLLSHMAQCGGLCTIVGVSRVHTTNAASACDACHTFYFALYAA